MKEGELPRDLTADLLRVAAAIDGEAAASSSPIGGEKPGDTPSSAPPAPPPPVDWTAEAREVVDLATEGFFPLYPRLREVWTDEKLERLTLRLGAVMQKYDLTLGKLLGKWGPEILLGAAIVPTVVPTYRVIRDTHRELREKAKQERPAPQPAAAATAAAPLAPMPAASSPKPATDSAFRGPPPPPDPIRLDLKV